MSFGRSIMSIKSNRNMICCMQLQMHHGSKQQTTTTTTENATKRTVFEERAKQLRRFMFVRVSAFRFFFCIDVGWQLPIRSFPFFEQISYILLMRIFRGWFARFPTLGLSFLDAAFFSSP